MLRKRARNYLEHLNPFLLLFPKFYSEIWLKIVSENAIVIIYTLMNNLARCVIDRCKEDSLVIEPRIYFFYGIFKLCQVYPSHVLTTTMEFCVELDRFKLFLYVFFLHNDNDEENRL